MRGTSVVVVGAGPAGLYLTAKLADAGAEVALLNRDLKPGGLAEYGIYPTKHKMKEGLRKQFRKILARPNVRYFGNVTVGRGKDLTVLDLKACGFEAVVVSAGAQGTKSLGLPGEDVRGVYHAKDLVYHFNKLPPFATKEYDVGRRVAVIGIGNVMVDIAHWLVRMKKVDEVVAVVRRGPGERKWTPIELDVLVANIDMAALEAELARVRPRMEKCGQDFAKVREEFMKDMRPPKPYPKESETRMTFRFCASPARVLPSAGGEEEDGRGVRCGGLEVEETELLPPSEEPKAKGTGEKTVLPVDGVVFAVGDRVDETLGLPYKGGKYVTAPKPDPEDPEATPYQVYDESTGAVERGVFVAGWSRNASEGVVGRAKQDGERCAAVVARYLAKQPARGEEAARAAVAALGERLAAKGKDDVVGRDEYALLEAVEKERAAAGEAAVNEGKLATYEEMLAAIRARRSAGVAVP